MPGKGKEEGEEVWGTGGFCCISHLIGLVEQTKPVARTQCVNIILFAAFREFVWLHILLANDGLRHYTSVPIAAEAFLTCKTEQKKGKRENQNTKYSTASRFYLLKIRYEKQFACREGTQQSMAQWKVFHVAAIYLLGLSLSLSDPRCKQASTLAVLTPIVVSHSNVVTNHVSHCSGQQVRLIHIDIHADADGTGGAHRLRDSHAGLTTRKGFPAVRNLSE